MKWELKTFSELSAETLYDLLALRVNVFIIEQACLYPELDYKDPVCHHLYAFDETSIHNESSRPPVLAYLRILPPGVSYDEVSIGRVLVSKQTRGAGLGLELMIRAFHAIKDTYGSVPIRISAQAYLQSFYETLGFETVSEIYLEDDIPHMEMLKVNL